MKRIVFGGFCMVSGALLFGQMMPLHKNLGELVGFLALCAEIAGAVLAVYGFYLGSQELGDGTEKQEDN